MRSTSRSEALGDVDRVLAGQAVDDEQGLRRLGRLGDGLHLAHQRVVDVETARGVEENDVIRLQLGGLERTRRDLDRRLARHDRQRVDVGLAAEHRQLLLRGRTGDVERRHQDALALALRQALGELGGGRRLTGALEADHHDDGRRVDVDVQLGGFGAERLDQRIVDDLDDHLARSDRADDFLSDRPLGDLVDEVARHGQSDVRLEQRNAHFAHRRAHVGFRERAAPTKPVKNAAEPIAQTVEHSRLPIDVRPHMEAQNAKYAGGRNLVGRRGPVDRSNIDVVSKRRARPSGCA